MENNNNFTKNYRDFMGIMSPDPIATSREVPSRRGGERVNIRQIELPNNMVESDGGDPYAISNMQIMDNIQKLSDGLRNSLLDIFGGTIGIGKRNNSSKNLVDDIYIDIGGVINNLKRISGKDWDKNYKSRPDGWIKLPLSSSTKSEDKKMPNYSGGGSTYEEMFVPRAPEFKYNNGGK